MISGEAPERKSATEITQQLTPEHDQWLRNTVTLSVIKKLEERRDKLLNNAMGKTLDSTTADHVVRWLVNMANEINTAINIIKGKI